MEYGHDLHLLRSKLVMWACLQSHMKKEKGLGLPKTQRVKGPFKHHLTCPEHLNCGCKGGCVRLCYSGPTQGFSLEDRPYLLQNFSSSTNFSSDKVDLRWAGQRRVSTGCKVGSARLREPVDQQPSVLPA